jgi:glycosyltransferase involved in cell wall biosynthesis
MRLLIISHKPPFPIVDGGCLAMNRFLDCLNEIEFIKEITYFSLATHKHPFNSESIPNKYNSKIKFKHHRVDTQIKLLPALNDLIRGKSYNLSRFHSKDTSVSLLNLCDENQFEIIIFESLFSCVYFDDLRKSGISKFIYRAHNIENLIWKNLSNNTSNPIKKWYINNLHLKLKKFEFNLIKEVNLIFPLSLKDEEIIKENTFCRTEIIPVSMPTFDLKLDYTKTSLCFIGAFNWMPNVEAMKWFSNEVFSEVRIQFPSLELHIAGTFSENISFLKEKEGIFLHGFVESSLDFIAKHGIFIAPLRSGSGVKMKVLEAMSLGSPVVLSEKGAEGIIVNPSFCKDSSEFIEQIIRLLKNQKEREEIGIKGKQIIENFYNVKTIQNKLTKLMREFTLENLSTKNQIKIDS